MQLGRLGRSQLMWQLKTWVETAYGLLRSVGGHIMAEQSQERIAPPPVALPDAEALSSPSGLGR